VRLTTKRSEAQAAKFYMNDPVTLALVFVGGAGGSAIRWLVGVGVGERYKGTFPLGTFLINVSGVFLMGFLSTLFNVDWRDRYGSNLTALVLTGVLGGYTTFSSYQLDTANLYNKRTRGLAAFYWIGSVAAGLIAAALGAITATLFG
jgi:CrcB protein